MSPAFSSCVCGFLIDAALKPGPFCSRTVFSVLGRAFVHQVRPGQQCRRTLNDVIDLAHLFVLGHRFRRAGFQGLWLAQVSTINAPDAHLHFSQIHRAHLLVHELVLDGPLVIAVEFTLGNVHGRAVIACRFRFRLLRENREYGGGMLRASNFRANVRTLILHSPSESFQIIRVGWTIYTPRSLCAVGKSLRGDISSFPAIQNATADIKQLCSIECRVRLWNLPNFRFCTIVCDPSYDVSMAPSDRAARTHCEIPTPAGWIRPVDDISFALETGESLGLVGESGSGKSMLALALMGLLPPGARFAARRGFRRDERLRRFARQSACAWGTGKNRACAGATSP